MKNGSWDLTSEEFTSRNLLGKMTLLDAKMSDMGVVMSELEKQYIEENCPFKVGEKIYYKHYTKNFKCGVIRMIHFDLDNVGFSYNIQRYNKGFVEPDSYRAHIFIKPNEFEVIKKVTET